MNKKGFTLIELVIVITVTGILASIAIPAAGNHRRSADEAKHTANVKNFHSAVALLNADKGYSLPQYGNEMNSDFKSEALKLSGLDDRENYSNKFTAFKSSTGDICAKLTLDTIYEYPVNCNNGSSGGAETTPPGNVENNPDENDNTSNVSTGNPEIDKLINEEGYTLATDEDFVWGGNMFGSGYQYIGDATKVVIPKTINDDLVATYHAMFEGTSVEAVATIDSTAVTSTRYMFHESQANILDVSNLDTGNVVDMGEMFWNSEATSIIGLDKLNTSNVERMTFMFTSSKAETLDVSNFGTSKVVYMHRMFQGTSANTIDVSNFNTSKVETMNMMFSGANAINIIGLDSFDTGQVTSVSNMFYNSKAQTLDLRNFTLTHLTSTFDTRDMFRNSEVSTIYVKNQAEKEKLENTSWFPTYNNVTWIIGN